MHVIRTSNTWSKSVTLMLRVMIFLNPFWIVLSLLTPEVLKRGGSFFNLPFSRLTLAYDFISLSKSSWSKQ